MLYRNLFSGVIALPLFFISAVLLILTGNYSGLIYESISWIAFGGIAISFILSALGFLRGTVLLFTNQDRLRVFIGIIVNAGILIIIIWMTIQFLNATLENIAW